MNQQNGFFAKALHDFTMNAAAGDAIKHLTDRGYTLPQIKEALTFPAPEEYIAKVMWDRMVETRKVLFDEPVQVPAGEEWGAAGMPQSEEIIEQRDRYGRKSFLRVQKESPEENAFSPEDYVQYENLFVLTNALKQVSSLSDHIPLKVRNTGSHRDT
ncbi:MAG: hypothetical protein J5910_07945 [Lachnospiraceae bacterium]|nr:hypothetical protein [Lachnospiraceae bacterium]